MPSNSERPPTGSRQEFCLGLKAARERKGITLHDIAASTKIPAYLFAALERGDLRRWPKGLFRRSFFRDYARMIGLPVAEACEEFVRLFPDAEVPELSSAAGLRLALDPTWHGPRASVFVRLLAAVIDVAAVILISTALGRVAGIDPLTTTAIVSLAYFALGTVLFGESPAKYALSRPAGQVMHLILEWTSEPSWRWSAWWPSRQPLQPSQIHSARTYSRHGESPSQKAVLISTSSSRPMEVET